MTPNHQRVIPRVVYSPDTGGRAVEDVIRGSAPRGENRSHMSILSTRCLSESMRRYPRRYYHICVQQSHKSADR